MPDYKMDKGSLHWKFFKCRKKVQILGGGFGNGKTAASCVKAIQLAMDYPGSNGLIARETYVKLNDTIRKEFYKWCPTGAVARWPTTTDNTLILKNGSTINFRYIAQRGKQASDGQTTSNLLSATFDWVVVDQMEDPQITYKDFLDLLGRLRGSTPYKGDDPTMPSTGPRWLIMTCNPAANWIYNKIVKPYHKYMATGRVTEELMIDEETREPMLELFEGSTYENAKNLPPDFLKGLEASYKGQMRKRYLMGDWAAYEGLVYPEFTIDSHTLPYTQMVERLTPRFQQKNRWTGIECLDIGVVVQTCYLAGYVDDLGRVFFIDGFYEPGLTTEKIGKKIRDIQAKYMYGIEFSEPIYADPAIYKQTQVNGKQVTTIAKILTNDENLFLAAGQNAIKSGIMKVSGYLAMRPGFGMKEADEDALFNGTNENLGPAMYFSDELDFVSEEFLGYFWKSNEQGERIDEPSGKKDHAMDAIKYALTRLPEASTLVFRKPVITSELLKWQEMT
jgi:phage terminase large subunit